jgi:hypothetical protein
MKCPECGKVKDEEQLYYERGMLKIPRACQECEDKAKAAYKAATPKDKRKKP